MANNLFMVGLQGGNIVLLRQVPRRISKKEALNLAAYLVAIAADDPDVDFKPILNEVLES